MTAKWEHFPHGADIGVRGSGPSVEQAFEQAARALTAIVADPARIGAEREVAISCEAPNLEVLLVDWLNALIYEMHTRAMLFSRFEVAIAGAKLTGRVLGEPVDRVRHEPAVEPKGATFTELLVKEDAEYNWVAQCVVDV